MMKVSILVPVYGVEKYIEKCAVSLFEQSYEDIEYIFVNDCTPDRSIEVLRATIARYPQRQKQVVIIDHDVNRGLGAARHTATEWAATGELVMHVDSDDYLMPHAVVASVRKDGGNWSRHGGRRICDGDRRPRKRTHSTISRHKGEVSETDALPKHRVQPHLGAHLSPRAIH